MKTISTSITYPKAIYVELTDGCNLNCSMCRCAVGKGDVLPLSLFEEVATALFPHAYFVDLRGWGESTILPNFMEYLEIAGRYPLRKKLISNGTVSKPGLWEELAARRVTVGFSIDASKTDLFKQLRGGANLDKVKANVNRYVTALMACGLERSEYAYFLTVVSGSNIDDIPQIVRMGVNLGIRRFKFEPIFLPAANRDRLEYHREAILRCRDNLREMCNEFDIQLDLCAALLPELVRHEAVDKLCNHPFEYLYINARGRLGFCDHLNGQEEFTFGHWREGFESFWNGRTMNDLRTEHAVRFGGGERIEICGECNWCYDNRYMDLENLVDPLWDRYRVDFRD